MGIRIPLRSDPGIGITALSIRQSYTEHQMDIARAEFMAERVRELMACRFELLMESETEGVMAINAIADAKGSLELFEAQDRFNAVLRRAAIRIAEREWDQREGLFAMMGLDGEF